MQNNSLVGWVSDRVTQHDGVLVNFFQTTSKRVLLIKW